LKPLFSKKPAKDQREKLVLLGLVEVYLKTGKPVGSNTLKENGFENLSPATIRNYFSKLEEGGYLKQQHSSGGRIPTNLAYKLYAESSLQSAVLDPKEKERLTECLQQETREISSYLQKCAEVLSDWIQAALFLSAPRFDQDFVLDVKLVTIDAHRCLCILVTDFGMVQTEVLYTDKKLSNFTLKRIEHFFRWKMTGLDRPELTPEEEKLAAKFYNEAMLRHIVSYSNFSVIDLYKTGFSKLLNYPDFNDASSLASGLSLFENNASLRALLSESCKEQELRFWIGEDLSAYSPQATSCAVLAVPYQIHQSVAGAIGILSPNRVPYKRLFGILKTASEVISDSLTKSLYKFKITYRQPSTSSLGYQKEAVLFSNQTSCLLLEDKTK
jgi:heat-inducible transcriptional repressor